MSSSLLFLNSFTFQFLFLNYVEGTKVLILIILEYIYIRLFRAAKTAEWCLNPYYTGIHLHIISRTMNSMMPLCLNPYYTGIHLHSVSRQKAKCLFEVS